MAPVGQLVLLAALSQASTSARHVDQRETVLRVPDVVGNLVTTARPDGDAVEFGYDALGRRVWKKFGAKTTKWIWDGNVPVHEWVEVDATVEDPPAQQEEDDFEKSLAGRKFMLTKRFAQGPPAEERGSADAPITWVFEPESFAPLAKLGASGRFGIVTDHLGTPTAMLDEAGKPVWSADIGVYGELENVVGEKQACPFRWPGQYEDEETGLYYNRFRYYDPEVGGYVSQDPIGLAGGIRQRSYPLDPLRRYDCFGLADPLTGAAAAAHLQKFENGSAVFVPKSVLDSTVPTYGQLGRSDGLFVTTREFADQAERAAGGDRAKMKEILGIDAGSWNEPIVRIDIDPSMQRNLRLATGKESGANKFWVPGGFTSGGAPEAVIDPIREGELAGKDRKVCD